MNNRVLTLSLFMAAVAAYFVWSYVSSIEDEARRKFGTEVIVLTAKRDIKEMETITEPLLERTYMPKKFVEPAAIFFEGEQQDRDAGRSLKSLAGAIHSMASARWWLSGSDRARADQEG